MQNKIWALVPAALLSLCLSTSVWGEEEYLPFIPLLLSGPTYTVTPLAGENGAISPNTPQYVKQGVTVSFEVNPDAGWQVASVSGCGGTWTGGNLYTTGEITGDCTVEASFGQILSTVDTLVISGNGSFDPTEIYGVSYNDTVEFTVNAAADWQVASVSGCGGTWTGGNPYTTGVITGDCTVEASFIVPTVISGEGRVWMDRNLGASQVATSMGDAQAYGDLYQWGRGPDDHQKRDSDITDILSDNDAPLHDDFIKISDDPGDWLSTQNSDLWQGVDGTNNPCPAGFRLPTESEWQTEINSWSSQDNTGAFNSPLKLVVGGYRYRISGAIANPGINGYYWSGTVDGTNGTQSRYVFLSNAGVFSSARADGRSVRCIED
jgi:uncharacterized protein (TIGR02145 family)